jgi:anti-sigma factor RsiW
MPKTDKTKPGAPSSVEASTAQVSLDDELAATVSAYLDGELSGQDLANFETRLLENDPLKRAVAEMRRIDRQLTKLGAEILAEPVPDALLQALEPLKRK